MNTTLVDFSDSMHGVEASRNAEACKPDEGIFALRNRLTHDYKDSVEAKISYLAELNWRIYAHLLAIHKGNQ